MALPKREEHPPQTFGRGLPSQLDALRLPANGVQALLSLQNRRNRSHQSPKGGTGQWALVQMWLRNEARREGGGAHQQVYEGPVQLHAPSSSQGRHIRLTDQL